MSISALRLVAAGMFLTAIAACQKASKETAAAPEATPSMASFTLPPPAACADPGFLPSSVHDEPIDSGRKNFLTRNGFCNYFVPEYHDEQRLTKGLQANDDYYGIAYSYAYPIPTVSPLQTHLGFDTRFVNVASVTVTGSVGPASSPYRGLNLQSGENCVYLKHIHAGASARWEARILPPVSGLCTGGGGAPIQTEEELLGSTPSDYPTVTRWMEGPGRKPLLGVRCGDRWCIIGPGANAALSAVHMGQAGAGSSSRWTVRGWHDEQTLGVLGTPSDHGILQNGPRLSLVPHDLLETRQIKDFLGDDWIPVATVIVPDGVALPAKYGARPGYGLAPGVNTISIRASGSYPYTWRARLTNSSTCPASLPNGGCVYARNVHWEDHSSLTSFVPGTARWRWKDNDEEMWVRCGLGCCMIQPD